jgi:HEAT repeat protein
LLNWISHEEFGLQSEIRAAFNRLHIKKRDRTDLFLNDPKYLRAEQAARAFATLGPAAEDAIGELTRMANDSENGHRRGRATFALAHLGAKGLPPLLALLTNEQAAALPTAAACMRFLGTNARPALPALIRCVQDKDRVDVAQYAANSLGNLRLEPTLVVPALVAALRNTNSGARPDIIAALGKFGPDAASAVPALLPALADPWYTVRTRATNALLKIAPEALTNARPM